MTRNEMLLMVVTEECAEIQQAISKTLRFGANSYHPDNPMRTNEEQIVEEYYQLEAVMKMLFDEGVLLPFDFNERAAVWDNKQEKVEKYLEVSKSLGLLSS